MMAVIQGLRQLKEKCDVSLYSDSAYVVDSIQLGRLSGWQKNNWRTSSKDNVKNVDLWKSMIFEMEKHTIQFVKVKGHADNDYNNRCDKIARNEIKKGQNGGC